jgi:hypothetical protein
MAWFTVTTPETSMPPEPQISRLPWRACMSPTWSNAPGTLTGRVIAAPLVSSWTSRLPPRSEAIGVG